MPEVDYPEFRHVGLVVRDIERCVAFYQELGFEVLVDNQDSAPLISDLLGLDVRSLRVVKLGRPPEATCVELLAFDPVIDSSPSLPCVAGFLFLFSWVRDCPFY